MTASRPDAEARVRAGFAGQPFMATLGARLAEVAAGAVTITCAFDERLTQQHGFVHAGVVAALADTAAGFAALTLAPPDRDVLTAGFTVDLLRPAIGTRYSASAGVVKAGRTLTVCRAEVRGDALCAVATVTLAMVSTSSATAGQDAGA